MQIRVLGAHQLESQDTGHVTLLIDDVLAIEAGALSSNLTLTEQQRLKAILLSHQHYDHVRDIPAIGMNFYLYEKTIEVYATEHVRESLLANMLNNSLYPNFLERPPDKPSIHFEIMEPGRPCIIHGHTILPVPVNHAIPTVGYQITSADGRVLFYTSDTGPGLTECWRQVSPELLFIEVTAPNRYEEFAHRTGHLTPALLHRELENFYEMKGYLPQIVLLHMNPLDENSIEAEADLVAMSLGTRIQFGYEGMRLTL